MRRLRVREIARGEILAAFEWYRGRSRAAAEQFSLRDHGRATMIGAASGIKLPYACSLGPAAVARDGRKDPRGLRAILDRLVSDDGARTDRLVRSLLSRSSTWTRGRQHRLPAKHRTSTGCSRLPFPSPVQDGRIIVSCGSSLNAVAERFGWKAEEVRTKAFRHLDRLPCHGVCMEHEAEIKTAGTRACGPLAETGPARLSAPSAAPGGNGPDHVGVRATLLELAGAGGEGREQDGNLRRPWFPWPLRRSHPRGDDMIAACCVAPTSVGLAPWRHGTSRSRAFIRGTAYQAASLRRPSRRRRNRVKTKEKVQELLDRLPDDCSLDDVLYHLYVVQQIERGLADVKTGRTIAHEQVAEDLRRKWVLGAAE